ncbi:MAG: triose-phosphate isomerase [Bacteroidetes bacterium]|nr:triose-phosphate isomerase [Bacteroidota bacterium]
MRLQIAAANWKMNTTPEEGLKLFEHILNLLSTIPENRNSRVIIAPPFTHLHIISESIHAHSKNPRFSNLDISLAAQNCSSETKGAYTGEVSSEMIKNAGTRYVIIGHSERRSYFREDNNCLARKIDRALENNLIPIYCCGETRQERSEKIHFETVKNQVEEGLKHISGEQVKNMVIAYEPVWAIGTGVNATAQEAQEMHAFIRKVIAERCGKEIAAGLSILYGGSCNPKNAKELFECPDIDGGLVGGASLNANDFVEIVKQLKR